MEKIKKFLYIAPCLPPGFDPTQQVPKVDFRCFVYWVIGYIEQFVIVIFALSVLVFIWGIFKYIFLSQGEEKGLRQARDLILYGVIGLFVMVSVWGIVNLMNRSLFGAG